MHLQNLASALTALPPERAAMLRTEALMAVVDAIPLGHPDPADAAVYFLLCANPADQNSEATVAVSPPCTPDTYIEVMLMERREGVERGEYPELVRSALDHGVGVVGAAVSYGIHGGVEYRERVPHRNQFRGVQDHMHENTARGVVTHLLFADQQEAFVLSDPEESVPWVVTSTAPLLTNVPYNLGRHVAAESQGDPSALLGRAISVLTASDEDLRLL